MVLAALGSDVSSGVVGMRVAECVGMTKQLFVACLFVIGCGVESDDVDRESVDLSTPVAGRCASLEGRRFQTVDLQTDCGPAPAGSQNTCRWSVSFGADGVAASSFVYLSSDVGQSGRVVCDGGAVIEVLDNGEPGIGGSYDPNTDRLEWDGIVFAPLP